LASDAGAGGGAERRDQEQGAEMADDRIARGFVPVPEAGEGLPDVVDAVETGELTGDQAAEQLQQAARRQVAEEGPTLDTDSDGTITGGGFGSGQGMEKTRTGN
jgi:hypothetical protein